MGCDTHVEQARRQLVDADEGRHERVRVRPLDAHAERHAREHVARAVEAANRRVAGGGHGAVWALRAAHAKLEQHLVLARRQAVARRVRAHERRKVAQVEQRRLEQLADAERALHAQQRDAREHDRALRHAVDLDLAAVERAQVLPERLLRRRHERAQVRDLRRREAEGLDEAQHLLEARKDGELAAERRLAEEHVERRVRLRLARLPVRVAHGDLVHVREERVDERVGRRLVRRGDEANTTTPDSGRGGCRRRLGGGRGGGRGSGRGSGRGRGHSEQEVRGAPQRAQRTSSAGLRASSEIKMMRRPIKGGVLRSKGRIPIARGPPHGGRLR